MEVPYKNDLETNAVIPSMVASVVAYLVFIPFYGTGPIFHVNLYGISITAGNFLNIFIVGILVGLAGIVFVKLFFGLRSYFHSINMPFSNHCNNFIIFF